MVCCLPYCRNCTSNAIDSDCLLWAAVRPSSPDQLDTVHCGRQASAVRLQMLIKRTTFNNQKPLATGHGASVRSDSVQLHSCKASPKHTCKVRTAYRTASGPSTIRSNYCNVAVSMSLHLHLHACAALPVSLASFSPPQIVPRAGITCRCKP